MNTQHAHFDEIPIDPGLADLEGTVRASATSIVVRSSFLANLETEMNRAANANMQGMRGSEDRPQPQFLRVPCPARRKDRRLGANHPRALVVTAFLAAVTLVAVTSLWWISRPAHIDAKQLLEEAAAATGTSAHITSFHVKRQYTGWLFSSQGAPDTATTEEQWGVAPDHWRTDTVYRFCSGCRAVDGGGSDGVIQWSYVTSPQGNGAGQRDDIAVSIGAARGGDSSAFLKDVRIGVPVSVGAAPGSPVDTRIAPCFAQARLEGDTTVAGRPAYVIDLGPNTCSQGFRRDPNGSAATEPPIPSEQQGRNILWVDKQTRFFLKQESYNADGTLKFRNEITEIQYNMAIPNDVFTYAPPPQAQVTDLRPALYSPPSPMPRSPISFPASASPSPPPQP